MQEFEVYLGSYRDSLVAATQLKEQIVNTGGLCHVKYVSKAYIERHVHKIQEISEIKEIFKKD